MKIIENVKISVVREHLIGQHSGVPLPDWAEEFRGYRVRLDDYDVSKLVLYWEVGKTLQRQ